MLLGRDVQEPPICDARCRPRGLMESLHHANNLCFRKLNHLIREEQLDEATVSHGWILGYLEHEQTAGRSVYQKDLEQALRVNRSTVSTTLRLMESRGYIRRASVDGDRRLKQVLLTPLGLEIHGRIVGKFHQVEELVDQCLTVQEREELLAILDKLEEKLR